jgi:hypothetical protein
MLPSLDNHNLITYTHINPLTPRRDDLHPQTSLILRARIDIPVLPHRLVGFLRMFLAGYWVDVGKFAARGAAGGKEFVVADGEALPIVF